MRKTFFTTHFRTNSQTALKKNINDRFIALFKQWSWAIAWTLFIAICLEYALQARKQEYFELQQERISLEKQLQDALALNEKYLQEINSQTDPAWLELVLIKKLGLVPEGQKKIIFVPKNQGFGVLFSEIQENLCRNEETFFEENSQSAIFKKKSSSVKRKLSEDKEDKPKIRVKKDY